MKNIKMVSIGVILLIAAFLRLYRIGDYMTFLGDEGRDVLVVYNILHGKFTLLGPTASVGGFFHGPIYYYFIAPFLWLSHYDPVGPAVMVGIIGVITVFLIYKIGSVFFSERASLLAAALYAVSPVVIAYSRSSWNPNLMPFFTLVALYLLYKGIRANSFKLLFIVGILLGILIQLHYIITFLFVVVASYVFLINLFMNKLVPCIKRSCKQYFMIFIGFLGGFSPFLLFEVRHGFQNIRNIFTFIVSAKETGANTNFLATIWNVLYRLFGRLLTAFPPPEQVSIKAHANIGLWYYLTVLLLIVSIGFFLFQWYDSWKKKNEKFYQYTLLLLWGSIGVFLFGFYKKPIYDYYLQFLFPLPFFLVGNVFDNVFSLRKNIYSSTGKILTIFIVLVLFYMNIKGAPFFFIPNRQKDQVKNIAEFVLAKTEGKEFNFALLTLGNSDHGYRYFFTIKDRAPVTIEPVDKDPQRKTVTQQLFIICEDPNCKPLGSPLWEIAGFGRAEIVGEWNVSVVKVYKLVHYSEK